MPTLTDADYQEYYNEHKSMFKTQEETRAIQYVMVDAKPLAKDSLAVKETINKLKQDLIVSKDDSLFRFDQLRQQISIHLCKKGQLSPHWIPLSFNVAVGTTVGPFLNNNGVMEIAKVFLTISQSELCESIAILLDPAAEGGVDKALAKQIRSKD